MVSGLTEDGRVHVLDYTPSQHIDWQDDGLNLPERPVGIDVCNIEDLLVTHLPKVFGAKAVLKAAVQAEEELIPHVYNPRYAGEPKRNCAVASFGMRVVHKDYGKCGIIHAVIPSGMAKLYSIRRYCIVMFPPDESYGARRLDKFTTYPGRCELTTTAEDCNELFGDPDSCPRCAGVCEPLLAIRSWLGAAKYCCSCWIKHTQFPEEVPADWWA